MNENISLAILIIAAIIFMISIIMFNSVIIVLFLINREREHFVSIFYIFFDRRLYDIILQDFMKGNERADIISSGFIVPVSILGKHKKRYQCIAAVVS